jgi:hypothetical protein
VPAVDVSLRTAGMALLSRLAGVVGTTNVVVSVLCTLYFVLCTLDIYSMLVGEWVKSMLVPVYVLYFVLSETRPSKKKVLQFL